MLYTIENVNDFDNCPILDKMSQSTIDDIKETMEIYDVNYNNNGIDGGHIVIAEDKKDLDKIGRIYFDCDDYAYSNNEYCDDLGDGWFKVLYILGTEYQIVMYVTRELVDKYF